MADISPAPDAILIVLMKLFFFFSCDVFIGRRLSRDASTYEGMSKFAHSLLCVRVVQLLQNVTVM